MFSEDQINEAIQYAVDHENQIVTMLVGDGKTADLVTNALHRAVRDIETRAIGCFMVQLENLSRVEVRFAISYQALASRRPGPNVYIDDGVWKNLPEGEHGKWLALGKLYEKGVAR